MSKYYALIIDLVKSRKLNETDRYHVQEKLNNAVEISNRLFKEHISKSLSFSAGDSVQGLFDDIAAAYSAYFFIRQAIFPHDLRVGIGFGNVNEKMIDKFSVDNSNLYDGQAYHFARNAIEKSKTNKHEIVISSETNFDDALNILINDDKFISMTLPRKAIYALINLMDPIVYQPAAIDERYFHEIKQFVKDITNYYRNRSRVAEDKKIKNYRSGSIGEISTEEMDHIIDEMSQTYEFKSIDYLLNDHVTTITRTLREGLFRLIGTSEQNINGLMRASNMDDLRKKHIAKLKIMNHFYGRD